MSDLLDALVLLAALQGAGLSVVLARRREDALAHRLLAALVGAVAAMLLLDYCEDRWGFAGQPHWLGLGAPLPFLFGPLLYLYIVALTRPVSRLDPRWLVHALPCAVYLSYMTLHFYVLSGDEKLALARAHQAGRSSPSHDMLQVVEVVQAVSYLAASWLALDRYGRKMRGYFSDLARIDLRWLRAMVLAHAATWSVVLVAVAVRTLGLDLALLTSLSRGVQLGSTLVIFLTGYMGLFQAELFEKAGAAAELEPQHDPQAESRARESVEPTPQQQSAPPAPATAPATLTVAQTAAETGRVKYQRNRIEDAEARELVERLLRLMQEQRPYRDGGLTLPQLADALGVTPHALSQILNVRVEKTFYSFVNSYRVAAVKAALGDPAQNARGVLEIAYEAGFNSKSTLNSFFKRETGLTPTEYRTQAQKRTQQVEAA